MSIDTIRPLAGKDIATLTHVELVTEISRLLNENTRLTNLSNRLQGEAVIHAMDARTANSTVAEVYQVITGARGEPGNWHGAEPVRKYVEAKDAEIARLQRENAALREDRYKLACAITGGEDAPGLLNSTPTSEIVEIAQHAHRMHQDDIDRAMAAEAEVERLQTELALSKPLYSRRQIEARVKLLEEALAPFAKIASDGWGSSLPDDAPLAIVNANMPDLPQWLQKVRGVVTQGDCRRARKALASTGGEHHGN